MDQREIEIDAAARRFLLGEMSKEERAAFEESFVANEKLFEQIRVIEDELIENYIRGVMPAVEREKFERVFLGTKRRRQRVEFARVMLAELSQQKESAAVRHTKSTASAPAFGDWLAGLFKTPRFVFAAAFVLLVLIFGGWFLLRNAHRTEIARQAPPAPANQNGSSNSNTNRVEPTASPNANGETPARDQNSNPQRPESTGGTPVLALFAGAVRASGKMPELNLSSSAASATLQLNIESADYKVYRAEVVDADGKLIWRGNKLTARNLEISLFVPAARLQRGDYLVKLSALNQRHETESVADYSFRVNRK